jgi:hypothetical protein
MNKEQLMEWELLRETQVFGENLLQCQFIYHKFQMTWSEIEPVPPRQEAVDGAKITNFMELIPSWEAASCSAI